MFYLRLVESILWIALICGIGHTIYLKKSLRPWIVGILIAIAYYLIILFFHSKEVHSVMEVLMVMVNNFFLDYDYQTLVIPHGFLFYVPFITLVINLYHHLRDKNIIGSNVLPITGTVVLILVLVLVLAKLFLDWFLPGWCITCA